MPNFRTKDFLIDSEQVDYFAEHFDGNPVHRRNNSNEVLPQNTAPGLMVVSLAAKAVLALPEYKKILCAKSFKIKFASPAFRGDRLYVTGTYEDSPHQSRPHTIFRSNECEIRRSDSNDLVLKYEITQLLQE